MSFYSLIEIVQSLLENLKGKVAALCPDSDVAPDFKRIAATCMVEQKPRYDVRSYPTAIARGCLVSCQPHRRFAPVRQDERDSYDAQ